MGHIGPIVGSRFGGERPARAGWEGGMQIRHHAADTGELELGLGMHR